MEIVILFQKSMAFGVENTKMLCNPCLVSYSTVVKSQKKYKNWRKIKQLFHVFYDGITQGLHFDIQIGIWFFFL